MHRAFAVMLLATLPASCALPLNLQAARHPRSVAADPQAPELALLELRLERHFADQGNAPPTTCAALGQYRDQRALPEPFEERLMLRFPRLAPFERCAWRGGEYSDAETGAPAVVFDVHDLACDNPRSCTAWAGFRQSDRVNGWRFYALEFADKWRVFRRELNIVQTGDREPAGCP